MLVSRGPQGRPLYASHDLPLPVRGGDAPPFPPRGATVPLLIGDRFLTAWRKRGRPGGAVLPSSDGAGPPAGGSGTEVDQAWLFWLRFPSTRSMASKSSGISKGRSRMAPTPSFRAFSSNSAP